jgi:hypothetical protein
VPEAKKSVAWPVAVAVLGLAAIGAGLYAWLSLARLPNDALRATRDLLQDARRVASAFRTGSVTTSFASYATQLTGSSRLQVATLRQLEVFERKDEAALFWGQLQLPDVIVEARAPVEYIYYLDFKEPWGFVLEDRALLVKAPPVRWNAPSVDVSALRYEIRKGSVLRDEAAVLEKLRLGLSELAQQRARAHSLLVRDTARRQTEEFVETWLETKFSDGGKFRARVTFADEPPARTPAG